MFTPETKLYVQLGLTDQDVGEIAALQRRLSIKIDCNPVSRDQLHLTILHIGKLSRLVQSMDGFSISTADEIMVRAELLHQHLQDVVKKYAEFTLNTLDLALFGKTNTTLVLRYAPVPALQALHLESLNELKIFFHDCGIRDVDAFMRQDENLHRALSISPHVSLARNVTGPLRNISLPISTRFTMMKIVY